MRRAPDRNLAKAGHFWAHTERQFCPNTVSGKCTEFGSQNECNLSVWEAESEVAAIASCLAIAQAPLLPGVFAYSAVRQTHKPANLQLDMRSLGLASLAKGVGSSQPLNKRTNKNTLLMLRLCRLHKRTSISRLTTSLTRGLLPASFAAVKSISPKEVRQGFPAPLALPSTQSQAAQDCDCTGPSVAKIAGPKIGLMANTERRLIALNPNRVRVRSGHGMFYLNRHPQPG